MQIAIYKSQYIMFFSVSIMNYAVTITPVMNVLNEEFILHFNCLNAIPRHA